MSVKLVFSIPPHEPSALPSYGQAYCPPGHGMVCSRVVCSSISFLPSPTTLGLRLGDHRALQVDGYVTQAKVDEGDTKGPFGKLPQNWNGVSRFVKHSDVTKEYLTGKEYLAWVQIPISNSNI